MIEPLYWFSVLTMNDIAGVVQKARSEDRLTASAELPSYNGWAFWIMISPSCSPLPSWRGKPFAASRETAIARVWIIILEVASYLFFKYKQGRMYLRMGIAWLIGCMVLSTGKGARVFQLYEVKCNFNFRWETPVSNGSATPWETRGSYVHTNDIGGQLKIVLKSPPLFYV